MKFTASLVSAFIAIASVNAFGGSRIIPTRAIRSRSALTGSTATLESSALSMADDNKPKEKEPELEGWARLQQQLADAEKSGKGNRPPVYEPGPYQVHLLSALAYVIPIVDSQDLGKYMFEVYFQYNSQLILPFMITDPHTYSLSPSSLCRHILMLVLLSILSLVLRQLFTMAFHFFHLPFSF